MIKRSRQEAIKAGFKRYFTGRPCVNGHVEERVVSSLDCLACARERGVKRYAADPTRFQAIGRVEYSRERQAIRERRWSKAGVELPTRPEPDNCECCEKPRGPKHLLLDHCHVTGEFRGWLCRKCNTGIGALGDCLPGVKAAVKYLERYMKL